MSGHILAQKCRESFPYKREYRKHMESCVKEKVSAEDEKSSDTVDTDDNTNCRGRKVKRKAKK